MALYPGYGIRNPKYETGIVIEIPLDTPPGSDQGIEFLGKLPYPFAPPAWEFPEGDVIINPEN